MCGSLLPSSRWSPFRLLVLPPHAPPPLAYKAGLLCFSRVLFGPDGGLSGSEVADLWSQV